MGYLHGLGSTLLLITTLLAACSPVVTPSATLPSSTPTFPKLTPTVHPPTSTPTSPPTPTGTAIPSPTPILTTSTSTVVPLVPLPTVAITSTPQAGWHIYNNLYLGYTIQYPPGISVHEGKMDGIDLHEPIPPGFDFGGYWDYMMKVLPKNICVAFSSQSSSVYIVPPRQWVGRFVGPCPGLGPGEQYRFEDVSLTVEVGGQEYTAQGTKLFIQETGAFDSEWYGFTLPNGFGVNYYGKPPAGMSEGDYLKGRAALLRILETLAWTREPDMTLPGWTCAGSFTHLLTGTYAQVKADNNTPNRVRSEPKKGDNTIAQLYPGTPFELLEGPVCADGLVFWKIRNSAIPGEVGWTAEGDGIEYYLVPYSGN